MPDGLSVRRNPEVGDARRGGRARALRRQPQRQEHVLGGAGPQFAPVPATVYVPAQVRDVEGIIQNE